jgi:hypothetical protein
MPSEMMADARSEMPPWILDLLLCRALLWPAQLPRLALWLGSEEICDLLLCT